MSSYFLVQVNNSEGYPNVTQNYRYENESWRQWNRNKAHGDVKPGDVLMFYCTSSVRPYPMSIALQATVDQVSSDHAQFHLSELYTFAKPLAYKTIRQMLEQNTIDPIFNNCGQEGFNIAELEPHSVEQIRELLGEDTASL